MSDINAFLLELRKKRGLTLREAAERSGLSHSYISSLENGKHPRTKAPISPSPESLKGLSKAYNYPYEELMVIAGHMKDVKNTKESDGSPSKSKVDEVVERVEKRLGITLSDDPVVMEGIEDYLLSIGKVLKNKSNP